MLSVEYTRNSDVPINLFWFSSIRKRSRITTCLPGHIFGDALIILGSELGCGRSIRKSVDVVLFYFLSNWCNFTTYF